MNNFFSELKRRNVFRAGAAYAIVAWLVIQIVVAIFPLFSIPEWLGTFIVVLTILGFPATLVISWFYEWTPKGLQTQEEADAKGFSKSQSFGRLFDFVVIALLAVAVGWLVYRQELQTSTIPEKSIAVLPFVNISEDINQEFFADGLTEELIGVLSQNRELKVTGRTSSFYFKGKNPGHRVIGETLGVEHILEGSVRRAGDRIRITAQLVSVRDGFHLWSETYDREFSDIFAIEDEITKNIATALLGPLGAESLPARTGGTNNVGAYNLYLQARQFLHQRHQREADNQFASQLGADNIEKAINLFETATVLDPEFSNAWSALARAYGTLPNFLPLDQVERPALLALFEKGKKAANRALELDPANAEAYSALNFINLAMNEWREAEINNAKAIALAPNDAEIANFAGDHYQFFFDMVNAVKWESRAYELDPLYQINSRGLGITYLIAGDFENALKFSSIAVDLDPNNNFNLQIQIYALVGLERYEEAHEILTQWKAKRWDDPFLILNSETHLFIREGRVEEARANLEKMEQLVLAGQGVSTWMFRLFFELGEIEAGLFWFEKAFEELDPYVLAWRYNFMPEYYTDDPELLAQLSLPAMEELLEIRRRNIAKNAAEGSE